jgi:molybdate transport system ATP-binding protein
MDRSVDRSRLLVDVRLRLSRLEVDARLDLADETLALVGPSGSGKSTILRAIAGLARPGDGRIEFEGHPWFDAARGIDLPPERRRVGLVFQHYALFPHLTVAQNVRFGVRPGKGKGPGDGLTKGVLARFGIEALASARPGTLSGGERQRVALARAVATDPKVLLLDEPLSALDAGTKGAVASELTRHLRALALPTILVSHDFEDVIGLADRVAVVEDGVIVQCGVWRDLVEAPVSKFVATLAGVNYFPGTAIQRETLTEVRSSEGPATFVSTDEGSGPVGVVVYPWDVALSAEEPSGSALNRLSGPVKRIAGVGNRIRVSLDSQPSIVAEITADSLSRMGVAPGRPLVASWKATGTRLVPRPQAGNG